MKWATVIGYLAGQPIIAQMEATMSGDFFTCLDRMKERVNHLEPFWDEKVGPIMRDRFHQNFQQGGPQGQPWQPLENRTVKQKSSFMARAKMAGGKPWSKSGMAPPRLRQKGADVSGHSILIKTGKLRDSYVQKGAAGHVERIEGGADKSTFFIGSQLVTHDDVAPLHQKTTLVAPDEPLKRYHVVSKAQLKKHQRGSSAKARVALAMIHEMGAPKANIPPRSQYPGGPDNPDLVPEDLEKIRNALIEFITGGG